MQRVQEGKIMKHLIVVCVALVVQACGVPSTDPGAEILDQSKGVVGKIVTLKTSPTLKSGSLSQAISEWKAMGWTQSDLGPCKALGLPIGVDEIALEKTIEGYAPENLPSYRLRLCASQVYSPKSIAVVGYVVSTHKTFAPKP
jgi:hypothetical protein